MILLGVHYHPNFQQIVFLDKETGEYEERQLSSVSSFSRAA